MIFKLVKEERTITNMIERNPMLQTFIDTFGLELVDTGRVE